MNGDNIKETRDIKETKIRTIYLDAGHSGINKFGSYITAPSKQFEHKGLTLHKGGWFFEGVSNRAYADELEPMLLKAGFKVIRTYHSINDTTLQERVNVANKHQRMLNTGNVGSNVIDTGLFLSLHSDASGMTTTANGGTSNGSARGYSVHTSVGTTLSDVIANRLVESYKGVSKKWNTKVRGLKENNFFVLKNTNMPAVLIENLFFDNRDDVQIIMNSEYRKDYCQHIVDALKVYL